MSTGTTLAAETKTSLRDMIAEVGYLVKLRGLMKEHKMSWPAATKLIDCVNKLESTAAGIVSEFNSDMKDLSSRSSMRLDWDDRQAKKLVTLFREAQTCLQFMITSTPQPEKLSWGNPTTGGGLLACKRSVDAMLKHETRTTRDPGSHRDDPFEHTGFEAGEGAGRSPS